MKHFLLSEDQLIGFSKSLSNIADKLHKNQDIQAQKFRLIDISDDLANIVNQAKPDSSGLRNELLKIAFDRYCEALSAQGVESGPEAISALVRMVDVYIKFAES